MKKKGHKLKSTRNRNKLRGNREKNIAILKKTFIFRIVISY